MNGDGLSTKRVKYLLQGLDCADCSQRLEQELHKRGFTDLQINFVAKSIALDTAKFLEVQEVIGQIEPDVKLVRDTGIPVAKQITRSWGRLMPIVLAGLLFIAAHTGLQGMVKAGCYLLAYLLVGGKVLARAWKNVFSGRIFDENFLIGFASLGAIAIDQFPEAVGVMLFYSIGEFFQDLAVNRSRASIRALMNIRPDYANVEENGQLVRRDPEEVEVGSCIVIKPGEKIPLDGRIIEGSAFIDTSSLTGESTHRRVEEGDQVLAGTINTTSLIKVEVSKRYAESSLAKIFELVESAALRKAPTERFITKFSRYYTPAVVVVSLGIAFIPPLLFGGSSLHLWIYRALTLLVISCPCALVLSIPLSYFGGIGAASRQGVLVKGSNYLEALTKVKTVVMDKTGTLTMGEFKVKSIVPAEGFTKEQLLRYTALAERYSDHPIAKSIIGAYSGRIGDTLISEYKELAGFGVSAKIDGRYVLVGNQSFLTQNGINGHSPGELEGYHIHGGTNIHVAIDGKKAGLIIIGDELRPDALQTVQRLRSLGVKDSVILSGDAEAEVSRVAGALGIKEFHAGLLPQDKVAWVEKLESLIQKGSTLVFVGDGINDAPVLAKAHIGVAMGGLGSDAAIEAADVVLMEDTPLKLVTAITIAKKTRKIVIENIVFALGFKLIVMVMGVIGLATMWEAVFADVGVALIAILNSSRILGYKGKIKAAI